MVDNDRCTADDDHEAVVDRSRQRGKRTSTAVVAALILSLYAPWGLVAGGVFKPSVAEIVSFIAGALFLGAWWALLVRFVDPIYETRPEIRDKNLLAVFGLAVPVAASVVVLAVVSWLLGWVGVSGIVGAFGLVFVMTGMTLRLLLSRVIRHGF